MSARRIRRSAPVADSAAAAVLATMRSSPLKRTDPCSPGARNVSVKRPVIRWLSVVTVSQSATAASITKPSSLDVNLPATTSCPPPRIDPSTGPPTSSSCTFPVAATTLRRHPAETARCAEHLCVLCVLRARVAKQSSFTCQVSEGGPAPDRGRLADPVQ